MNKERQIERYILQIILFLVSVMGATMLLLYAVKLVQTGVERTIGASFNRWMSSDSNPITLSFLGTILAIILQSSTSVSLLVASFINAKNLNFIVGLPIVLGADFGSAIVVQLLTFHIDGLMQILLAIGGWFFLKSKAMNAKNIGRILLGVAFILISLQLFRDTMTPIKNANFLPFLDAYLQKDYVAAFVIGLIIAIIMHSSVAVVLIVVTLVSIEALNVKTGISLVLGANMGSPFIPLIIARDMISRARRVALANLILRGVMAIVILILINFVDIQKFIKIPDASQIILALHLTFNAMLLIFVPFRHYLEPIFARLLPDQQEPPLPVGVREMSALDESALSSPTKSIAALRREVIRMSQLAEHMLKPIMDVFEHDDKLLIKEIEERGALIGIALDGVRHYVASMPDAEMKKNQRRSMSDLAEYAISLDSTAEIIKRRLITVAKSKNATHTKFSETGWSELKRIHEQVVSNMSLAFDVLVSQNPESALVLIEAKHDLTERQRQSRKLHIKRIRNNAEESILSSDLHLETLGALKDVNSQLASIGYLILDQLGTKPSHEFITA